MPERKGIEHEVMRARLALARAEGALLPLRTALARAENLAGRIERPGLEALTDFSPFAVLEGLSMPEQPGEPVAARRGRAPLSPSGPRIRPAKGPTARVAPVRQRAAPEATPGQATPGQATPGQATPGRTPLAATPGALAVARRPSRPPQTSESLVPRAKAVGQRLSPARKAAELAARRQRLKRAAGITVRDPATAGAPEAGFEAARRSVPEFRGTEPSRRNAAPGPAPGPPGEAPARAPGLGQLLKLRLSELLEQREPDSGPRQDGPPTEAVEPLRSPLSVDRVADAGRRHEPWPQALAPTADRRGTGAGRGNDEVQPPAPARARLLEDAPSPRDEPDDPFFDEAYRHGVDLS